MFHFPRCPSYTYVFSARYRALPARWVTPFGNPRIKSCLPLPRGLSQAATSFIGFLCRGIHRLPLMYALTPLKRENVVRRATDQEAYYPFHLLQLLTDCHRSAELRTPIGISDQRQRMPFSPAAGKQNRLGWLPSGVRRTHGVSGTAREEFTRKPHIRGFSRVMPPYPHPEQDYGT